MSYNSIIRSSVKIRENFDPEAIFHAAKQLLEYVNPKAKALLGKILLDPQDLTEATAYLKELEKPEPVLTHEDFFKVHDNIDDLSLKKINEIATVFREGWSKIVYKDLSL